MRKERVRPGMKKIDVVVTSARYDPVSGRILQARAFERWGDVWSDILLLRREDIVARIDSGRKVVTGTLGSLPGEFEVAAAVRQGAGGSLVVDGIANGRDDLQLPTY